MVIMHADGRKFPNRITDETVQDNPRIKRNDGQHMFRLPLYLQTNTGVYLYLNIGHHPLLKIPSDLPHPINLLSNCRGRKNSYDCKEDVTRICGELKSQECLTQSNMTAKNNPLALSGFGFLRIIMYTHKRVSVQMSYFS